MSVSVSTLDLYSLCLSYGGYVSYFSHSSVKLKRQITKGRLILAHNMRVYFIKAMKSLRQSLEAADHSACVFKKQRHMKAGCFLLSTHSNTQAVGC